MGITEQALFGLSHYDYGEAYFGSYGGMRFRLARDPLKNVRFIPLEERDPGDVLLATVWPEPYSYADTAPEKKKSASFPPTQEGYRAAIAWLNEQSSQYGMI
ncbi:MAG: hypothetical protein IJT34_07870 [Butyrivibrio sp.]|nr:hypothetical protein [Butyrivibrio sp.]